MNKYAYYNIKTGKRVRVDISLKELGWFGRNLSNHEHSKIICPNVGVPGHHGCGWCWEHNRPRNQCTYDCHVTRKELLTSS